MYPRASILSIALLGALATGCAYGGAAAYESTGLPAAMPQPMAASYSVPAQDPKGTVGVISFGAERLAAGPGQPDVYLHMRLAVDNRGDTAPWTAAAGEQALLAGPGGARLAPSFAQASSGGPQLTVAPGSNGSLDLFYALPQGQEPPVATLEWRLVRSGETLTQTTTFERQPTANPAYASYYGPRTAAGVYVGIGPAWWYGGGWGLYGPGYYGWWGPRPYLGFGYYGGPRVRFYGGARIGGWGGGRGWGGGGWRGRRR